MYERVSHALAKRGLPDLSSDNAGSEKIEVIQSRLGDVRLGLENEFYERLARDATIILHLAWAVNFRMRLKSFDKEHIAGKVTIDRALQKQDLQNFKAYGISLT